MGMSYKRAWMMVESMNRGFRRPLVAAAKGGTRGGGGWSGGGGGFSGGGGGFGGGGASGGW